MRIRVKICGITSFEDARHAISFGADAIGFIFVRKSPRYVLPEKVKEIVSNIPPLVQTVGVFVNEPAENVREFIHFCGLDMVQFHGEEPPEYCLPFSNRAIKAFRVKDESVTRGLTEYEGCVRAILLDSWSKRAHGGTGKAFDWKVAKKVVEASRLPVILAGGLNVDLVSEAVQRVRPYGLDVSSGVEKGPGIKDKELVKEFIKRANQAAKNIL